MTYKQWRSITLAWPIGVAVCFTLLGLSFLCGHSFVGEDIHLGSTVLFFIVALVHIVSIWLPQNRLLRPSLVALPIIACGIRGLEILLSRPIQWPGAVVALVLGFIFITAGPQMLPPPISIKQARTVLKG